MRSEFEISRPRWARYAAVSGGLLVLFAVTLPGIGADNAPVATGLAKAAKANYELAARWTPTKVGKLVFDTAVTPHWLDSGDRFWYTYENNRGRRFYIVDPAAKNKNLLFDPARMAASLTEITGIPYEAQHLPVRTVKFVKNDSAFQFELAVETPVEQCGGSRM